MQCINCDNEAKGKSMYCGDTCKTVFNRNRRNTKTVTKIAVTPGTVTELQAGLMEKTKRQAESICKPLPESINQADFNQLIEQLPAGVPIPLGLPTLTTANLSAQQLRLGVKYADDWRKSSEYAEIIHRLVAQDIPDVEMIPAWRAAV